MLGELIADGAGYQDWLARHTSFDDVHCRVRQYTVAQAASEEDRQRLRRAAAREFQIIQTLDHPGILPVLDYKEHENGPALLFRYLDPHAVRFDHYLATNAHKLTTDQRLDLLRQVADAVRYAHRKRVIHRALEPPEHPGHRRRLRVAPAPDLQLAGGRPGVGLHLGPGDRHRGSGRVPGPRLPVARGPGRRPQGHRGVGRVLARGHRLPPVRLPAARPAARPTWRGSCGSKRG